MRKSNQSKKKGPPESVNEGSPPSVDESNTISPNLGVITPLIAYANTTEESNLLDNQSDTPPPDIPDKSTPSTGLLRPLVQLGNPYSLKDPSLETEQLDIPTLKHSTLEIPNNSSLLPPSASGTVNRMIPTPPKPNQTAIAILITINQQFFGLSFANVWGLNSLIGHLGENKQFYGGEHFKFFSNLTSTWIRNSPLGGLNLWFVSINHDNDHLEDPFPNHTGFNYSLYMAFAKKIGRAGMVSKKINGAIHYSVRYLTEREESDLSTIITLKAAERAAIREAALLASAPTNQEIEDLFN